MLCYRHSKWEGAREKEEEGGGGGVGVREVKGELGNTQVVGTQLVHIYIHIHTHAHTSTHMHTHSHELRNNICEGGL